MNDHCEFAKEENLKQVQNGDNKMAKKAAAKQRMAYNKEICKLLLEFLALAVTLSACMVVLDMNKKKVMKAVLGAMTQNEVVYESKAEECQAKYERNCQNPSINYCVDLAAKCKDVVELR